VPKCGFCARAASTPPRCTEVVRHRVLCLRSVQKTQRGGKERGGSSDNRCCCRTGAGSRDVDLRASRFPSNTSLPQASMSWHIACNATVAWACGPSIRCSGRACHCHHCNDAMSLCATHATKSRAYVPPMQRCHDPCCAGANNAIFVLDFLPSTQRFCRHSPTCVSLAQCCEKSVSPPMLS